MNIAILGGGNLGTAIARGITEKALYKREQVYITCRNTARLEKMKAEGFRVTAATDEAIRNSGVIVISVLPQQLDDVRQAYPDEFVPAKQTVLSIVTGVSVAALRQQLGPDVPIVRAMPNTAIAIGQSMTCMASDDSSAPEPL